jgi:hypothetical protein
MLTLLVTTPYCWPQKRVVVVLWPAATILDSFVLLSARADANHTAVFALGSGKSNMIGPWQC